MQEATGIAAWFLSEMQRNVDLEAEVAAAGSRLADPTDEDCGHAPRHGQARRVRRPRAGRPGRRRRGDPAAGPTRPRPSTRVRHGRHLRRGVRGRDAVLLRDLCRRRLAARGAAGRAPGRARHRLGAGPDRAGDRVRLLRGPGRRHAPPGRLAGGDDQLEPGDRVDGLRRELAPLLRAARPGERAERDRGRDRPRRPTLLPAMVAFGGQTPLNLAAPLAAARRDRSWAATSRRSTRPRSGPASPRSWTALGSRSPRAAWPTASRRR